MSDCFGDVQDEKVPRCMLGTKEITRQVAVVLAEYRSMLCLQWTPSAEELGPGLDYVMEAEEEPGSQQMEGIQILEM